MTPAEIDTVLSSITFGYPFKAWGMQARRPPEANTWWLYYGAPSGTYTVEIHCHPPHRDGGTPIERGLVNSVYVPHGATREQLIELVFKCARDLVLHELDEAWHVDGVRCRDPHLVLSPQVTAPPPRHPPESGAAQRGRKMHEMSFDAYAGGMGGAFFESAYEYKSYGFVPAPIPDPTTRKGQRQQLNGFLNQLNRKADRRAQQRSTR